MARTAVRSGGIGLAAAGVAVLLVALFAAVRPALAAPSAVDASIVDFSFSPSSIAVKTGDSVTWTNNGQAPHTATADNGSFDTGILNSGDSGSVTFSTEGTFAFHCAVHPEMTGSVTASGSSTLPETGDEVPGGVPIALLAAAGLLLLGGGGVLLRRTR
jgi:plastocyanin